MYPVGKIAFSMVVFLAVLHTTYGALSISTLSNTTDAFVEVEKGIVQYFSTGVQSNDFLNALKSFNLKNVFRKATTSIVNTQLCILCNLVIGLIIGKRKLNFSKDTIASEITFLCVAFQIESERVCKGVIDLNADPILYILDNYPNLTPTRFCGSVLQSYSCYSGDNFNWELEITPGNSPERLKEEPSRNDSFAILQLSDFHYDPMYKPYGNNDCGDPICCQTDNDEPSSANTTCGYWSDYNLSDSPWHLIEEATRHAKTHNFEYVYYTGDIISHRVWDTTNKRNAEDIQKVFSFFEDSFDVPVYPVFGNHETSPLNVWASENVTDKTLTVNWLFQLAADIWPKLMQDDNEELKATILHGGYYTSSPRPGFRIIGLNNNVAYIVNWWIVYQDYDQYGQLQWLQKTLELAEKNDESVHIIAHVPSGTSECLKVWSRAYNKIVRRFSNTITGQFNGHTHKDEFSVYYSSSNSSKAVGVAFNGASVTPYSDANPSYKIYSVDSKTFTLLDYEEFTFNLTEANLKHDQTPNWYRLYSFVEAYGVKNCGPAEVNKALHKMATEPNYLEDYSLKYYHRQGDAGLKLGCDKKCLRDNLCSAARSEFGDDTQCNSFSTLYDANN